MDKVIIFIVLFFKASLVTAQADVSLRLKTGDIYTLAITEKNTIIQTIEGKEQKTVNTQISSYSFRILDEKDSLYIISAWFNELTQIIESAEENSSHSSKNDNPPDFMCTLLKKIINQPFRVSMDRGMNLKNVSGLDSIFFRTYAGYDIPVETKEFLDTTIRELVNELSETNDLTSMVIYPSKTIKPNEIWTVNSVTEHVVSTFDSCNYYISEITGDDLIVKMYGRVTSLEDENIYEGIGTRYFLKGITEATVRFDKTTGWIKQAHWNTDMQGVNHTREISSSDKQIIPIRIIREISYSGY